MRKFTMLFVSLIVVALVLLILPHPALAATTWGVAGWTYRKSHSIGSATGAGTNYQVMITVYYTSGTDSGGSVYLNGKCKTDFGDIRFTAADGSTPLDYWRQSYTASTSAVFWVEVSADLGSSAQTIYIYYGNSSATTTSSGTNTFIYYDDGSSTTGWTANQGTIGTNLGTTTLQGNPQPSLFAQEHAAGGQYALYRNSGIAPSTFTSFNIYTETGNLGNFYYLCNSSGLGQMYRLDSRGSLSYTGFATTTDWNTWTAPAAPQTSPALTWFRFGIAINSAGNSSTLYYDATNSSNPVPGTSLGAFVTTNDGGYIACGGDALAAGTLQSYWDNIITRKYVTPEPANGIYGTEEVAYVWTHGTSTDWQVAANWTPTRTTPATTDILQFTGGASVSVTNVPTQTIGQLIFANSSTANLTPATAGNTLTVNDALTTTSGDVLNLGTEVLGGTLTTLTNSGKIQTAVLTSTSATPIPASKTWGGTVEYNGSGAQTAVAGTYTTLKVNNSTGVTLGAASTVTTLTIGDVTSSSIFSDGGSQITSTGTLNLNNSSTFKLGNAAATTWPAFVTNTISAGTTVEYASAVAQTVSITPSYSNLTFSGAGTKTPAAGTLTIGGNWSVGSATALNTNNNVVNLTGDLTGTGNITQGTALITVGGSWLNTGTFTASATGVTLTGSSKSITGASGLTFTTLTVSGTYTNNNPGTLTVSTALSGTGGLTQAASATLNIGGTSGITTLTATNTSNTVNYTGAAQTVHANNYYHLTLSGSGTDVMQAGTTAIGGNFTVSGSVTTTTAANLAITGTLSTGNGTSLTIGAFTLSVGGTTTVGGGATGTLAFSSATNPSKTFTGLVTINAGASWTESAAITPTFQNGITNSGTFTASTGLHTFDTNSQGLTGTFSIPSVTVTGVTLTNNNSLTVGTALSGTGGLTQAASATLNIGGTSGISTLAATASSNTVNYTAAASQTVFATNYANLGISGGGSNIKTLGGSATTVSGTCTIAASTTLSFGTGSARTLTLSGTGADTISSSGTIDMSGGNLAHLLQIAASSVASFGTLTNGTGNTVEYYASGAQTVNAIAYRNLTLSGSGAKALTSVSTINGNLAMSGSATATTAATMTVGGNVSLSGTSTLTTGAGLTITGNLSIGDGTAFTAAGFAFTVTGTTTVGGGTSGSLTISSATGAKLFTGLVTISANGTWTNTSANSPVEFRGGITNSGAFAAGSGAYSFTTTSSQALIGTLSIPSVTVTGVTLTNNNTLTVGTALSGTGGTLAQAASATLYLGGTSGITTITATNTGNTVEFNGTGAQTIPATNFYNLNISGARTGSNSVTLASGTIGVAGAFNPTATFSSGNYVTTGNTMTFNGSALQSIAASFTFNNLTISNSTGVSLSGGGTTAVVNGTLALTSGTLTVGANALTIAGASVTRSSGAIDASNASATIAFTNTSGLALPASVFTGNVNNLTINGSGVVALGSTTTVIGTLTLTNGNIIAIGANQINLGTSATISGGSSSSYVYGTLQKSFNTGSGLSFTYPIGDASNYTPVNLASLNVTTTGSVSATTTGGGEPPNISTSGINAAKDVNRYWTLTASGIAVSGYDATFNFVTGDKDGGATTGNFVVRKYNAGWSTTTTGTKTSTSTQATSLTSFSDFALGEQAIDHYSVSATTPQTAGAAFTTTVTAQDALNQTVSADSSTVVTMTGTGNVQFDSDGNGTFGDNTKTLSSGTFTISTKDNTAETINITATDGNSKTGTVSGIVITAGTASKLQVLMPGETAAPGTTTG